MLTESEAWRMIGEAFEARAAHQDLVAGSQDLAYDGMCSTVGLLAQRGAFSDERTIWDMEAKLRQAVSDQSGKDIDSVRYTYLQPWITEPGGSELRAMLAYLFAEEAAS